MIAEANGSVWSMTVHRSTSELKIDEEQVREALQVLLDPKGAHEIRGLKDTDNGKYVRSRMVRASDLDAAIKAIDELGDCNGIYYTLNAVKATLGDRAAKVGDILSRRLFLVDIDRFKPKGQSEMMATDQEKAEVFDVANKVCDWLLTEGWPFPTFVDSGNGAHLLFRVDLPANELTRQVFSRALKALAQRWNTPAVEIDIKVVDAPRISKLPGTWVRKGSNTAERPWRIAHLMLAGDPECVTIDQLEALCNQGKVHPDEEPIPSTWEMVYKASPDRVEGYVKSALDREITKVVLSNAGGRNNALNQAGFAIGQFVGGGFVSRSEAERRLVDAAKRTGLGDFEIERTVRSSLDAGVLLPRVLPDSVVKASSNGVHPPKPSKPLSKYTVGLDEIKPEKVDWLYENVLAPGFITIFAGRSGLGKSFVTCDIVAKLSYGFSCPYSNLTHPPIRTLFISEDSPTIVLGPRLMELGADRPMVRFMNWEALAQYTLGDTEMLTSAWRECSEPRLLVIDPPSNFLGGVDEHKNAEVRSVLKCLIAWLDKYKVACILITHINKAVGKGLDAIERIIGSVAWGTSARITVAFAKDPTIAGQFLCGGTKNNLGELADTLAYKIEKTDSLATIVWLGKADTTMEDAMNQVKKKSRGMCAVEWLGEQFRARREWESEDLMKNAKEAGLSRNSLFSPEVNALPIRKRRLANAAGEPRWVWVADFGWPAEIGIVGIVGTVET